MYIYICLKKYVHRLYINVYIYTSMCLCAGTQI